MLSFELNEGNPGKYLKTRQDQILNSSLHLKFNKPLARAIIRGNASAPGAHDKGAFIAHGLEMVLDDLKRITK
jgi:hypothetical protein